MWHERGGRSRNATGSPLVADPVGAAINDTIVVLFTSGLPRLWWGYLFGPRGM